MESAFRRGDEDAFARTLISLPWLSRADGFITELTVIICGCLPSGNPVVVDGCLRMKEKIVEKIVKKHARALGYYNIHRMIRGLALLDVESELQHRAHGLLLRLMRIDSETVDDAFQRLLRSDDEGVRERACYAFQGMLSV